MEEYAVKKGYGSGDLLIGIVVKRTEKTVTVREYNWNGLLGSREYRWMASDVLYVFPSYEKAQAASRHAKEAWKRGKVGVDEARANLKFATEEQERMWRAAVCDG